MRVAQLVVGGLLLLNLLVILLKLARSGTRRVGFPIPRGEWLVLLPAAGLWGWFGVLWFEAWWGALACGVGGLVLALIVGVAGTLGGHILDWIGVAIVGVPFYLYGVVVLTHGAFVDVAPLIWARAAEEHPMIAGGAVVALGYSAFQAIHDLVEANRRRADDHAQLLARIRSGTI